MSDKTDPIQSNTADAPAAESDGGASATGAEALTKSADVDTKSETRNVGDALAEARAEAQKNREQWVRTAADYDNFRKRSRREVEDSRKSGREELLKDFLPVFDNLERALQSAQRATEVKGVVDGLTMIMKQFGDTLGRSGITKVPTKGNMFDPSLHEAIQQVESDEVPGTCVAEVQAGYLQGDRLIRAALVVVAQPRANAASPKAEGKADAKAEGKADAKPDTAANTKAGATDSKEEPKEPAKADSDDGVKAP